MHSRTFSFDKFKNKLNNRHQSETSILELAATTSQNHKKVSNKLLKRNSIDIPSTSKSNTSSSSNNNSNLSPPPPLHNEGSRLRASSLSFVTHHHHHNHNHNQDSNDDSNLDPNRNSRSRSRSRSRSFAHTQTLSPSNFFKNKTKDLVKQETAQIISKKLIHMLQSLGLQNPITVKTLSQGSEAKNCRIYVSNTNDCIYLPPATSASFTYEDVENGGTSLIQPQDDDINNEDNETASIPSSPSSSSFPEQSDNDLFHKMKSFHSPNYLCSKIDPSNPIPHTFAVIVELTKDNVTVKDFNIKFQSITNILWPTGDLYNRSHAKEKFIIGDMEWNTSLKDADYYINNSNSNDVKSKHLTAEDLIKRTREYKLASFSDATNSKNSSTSSVYASSSNNSSTNLPQPSTTSSTNDTYKAGLYVFLLPILLPEHIPATIVSINGTLFHTLSVNFNKLSDKLNRKTKVTASYNLPMVRTPPNIANSIADKPIYVNRVWNDAVHYIITFPRKYVSLGNEHVINVKLAPLVKDVIIKRIKFNILERITYVSKNLSREYDFDSEDPYCCHPPSKENKVRERVVSLCELKTKNKQTSSSGHPDAYKEEIIKCPENNLLFSCYELEQDVENKLQQQQKKSNPNKKSLIASPLDINIALPFLTTRSDKTIMTSAIEDDITDPQQQSSPHTSRRASIISEGGSPAPPNPSSPIIGALETNLVNVDEIGPHDYIKPNLSNYLSEDMTSKTVPSETVQNGYTLVARALYPDSNYRHIQINHRLQVCFRISKPDPKDDFKMHHYEVVVDTPLVLLSSKCGDTSIQLPKYDEINELFSPVSTTDSPPVFRTPNFTNGSNGISIKPLVNSEETIDDDILPSFEQATAEPANNATITRSMSVAEDPLSRMPSISIDGVPAVLPGEPAPAYQPPSSNNIDELVDDSTNVEPSDRKLSIKQSLSHSFAKPKQHQQQQQSKNNSSDDNSIDSSGSRSSALSNDNSNITPPSSMAPDSTSMSSETDEEEDVVYLDDGNIHCAITNEDDTLDHDETNSDENQDEEVSGTDNEEAIIDDDEDGESLFTQDSNLFGTFEQRIPLLSSTSRYGQGSIHREISTDSVMTQRKYMESNEASDGVYETSNDSMVVIDNNPQGVGKPQDIHRTYL
ncbi:ECM21 Protein ECM21 [Candida maltosa Xu316]